MRGQQGIRRVFVNGEDVTGRVQRWWYDEGRLRFMLWDDSAPDGVSEATGVIEIR